jgi:hypothetical protein
MDFNRNLNGVIVNPYEKRPAATAAKESGNSHVANDLSINAVVTDFTMGVQSQLREGAIKKCKKIGTKVKARRVYKQNAIGGGVAFVEALHCSVCKARRLNARGNAVNIPHRPHHKKCSMNRKTRGLSAMTVFVNREATQNIAINTAPMASVLGQRLATEAAESGANIARFFAPYPQLNPASTNVAQLPLGTNEVVAWRNQQGGDPQKFQQKTRSIREVLDDALGSATNQDQELKWLEKTKYSKAMTLAIDTILKKFEHRKSSKIEDPLPTTSNFSEAMKMYHCYFPPGTCTYTFPPDISDDSSTPSPYYHFIAGESFIYLDWKLISPKVELYCFNCLQAGIAKVDCRLKHDRSNFSKSKALFPVWTGAGRPTLSVLMNYRCDSCSSLYLANDGRILAQIDAHIREPYKVDPKYAEGTFHFHIDLTDDLEVLMKTYASGSYVGKKMHRKLGIQYARKVETYLSQFPGNSPPLPNLQPPSFEDFSRGFSTPSSAAIRSLYSSACYSNLTPYGYSTFDRNVREIQNVQIREGDAIAIDWTFQVVKNYNLPGAKAMFTANVGRTKEVFALALVTNTSVSQVSHMLIEIIQKRETNFKPSVLYHDTCPHNQDFWRLLFGANLKVRLGLFHLLHRIIDTLDTKCELYWKGLVSLKKAVYRYDDNDLSGLLTCLREGSFSRDGKKHSETDIDNLRHSKRWKERCDQFLRKVILSGPIIAHAIERWIVEFSQKEDSQGRPLFTRNTEKVAKEQTTKVKWVQDPQNIDMYRKIPPGKRSINQLPKWLSNRPESGLEKFHEHLAHLANTGCGKALADALTMGGTADYNVKARWKENVNKQKLLGTDVAGTVEYLDEPRFYDHSYLHLLNNRAISLGLDPIFDFVVPPREENGEVFLSKYFEEQEKRNSTVGQDKKTKLCNCLNCRAYLLSEPADPQFPEQEEANDPVETDQQQEQEQEVLFGQRMVQCAVNSTIVDAILPSVAPWFYPSPLSLAPSDCCFSWPPFYCKKKREYYNRKYHGGGRKGRPPKCEFNCQGQI